MKKTVYVYTSECVGDEAFTHEADPDASEDELMQAAKWLYPLWLRITIEVVK